MNAATKINNSARSIAELVKSFEARGFKAATRKVCWVTDEILGLFRNGGAGTAVSGFCEATIAAGHELTVLYTARVNVGSPAIVAEIDTLHRKGHNIVFLQDVCGRQSMDMSFASRSFIIDQWLRKQQFDIIHFHEFNGSGHYACLAKRQGLAYADTLLCMTIFGSTRWAWECMEMFVNNLHDLERDYLERKSIENADYVLCHSRYMSGWLSRNATQLPPNTFAQPSIMPSINIPKTTPRTEPWPGPINEVVFFGRQEVRKGMRIFTQAIELLSHDFPNLRFTFLGKFSKVDGEHSGGYVLSRLANIPNDISFLADFDRDEALRYLKRADCLAVMPSADDNFPGTVFEAILEGLEFITTNRGGIPEIVHPDCHADRLFEFSGMALANAVRRVIAERPSPARLAFDQGANSQAWMDWHALAPAGMTAFRAPEQNEKPLVSLCIVHYDRPRLLAQVIEAVKAQTYNNIEVILIDDGSPSQQAINYVAELEAAPWRFPFRVIRTDDIGLAAARNAGAEAANGEFVIFIDDDNVPMAEMTEILTRAAVIRRLDVGTTLAYLIEGDAAPPASTAEAVVGYFPPGGPTSAGLINNVFGDANAIFRREVFKALGGFDTTRGIGAEDWDLFARAVLKGHRLEVVAQPTYWYRRHSGQLTARPHSRHAYFDRLLRTYWANIGNYKESEAHEAIMAYQGRYVDEKIEGEVWHNLGLRQEGELQRQLLPHINNSDESYRVLSVLATKLGRVRDAARLIVRRDMPLSQLAALDSQIAQFYRDAPLAIVQGIYSEESQSGQRPRSVPILRSILADARYLTADRGNFAWNPIEINLDNNFIGLHPLESDLSVARIPRAIAPGASGVIANVAIENPQGPVVRFHLMAMQPENHWNGLQGTQFVEAVTRDVGPIDGRLPIVLQFESPHPLSLDLILVTESLGSIAYAWARFSSLQLLYGTISRIQTSVEPPAPTIQPSSKKRWWSR